MIIRTTRTRPQARLAVGKGSLIGYWPLDDRSGTAAKDRSGNARDAAYSGTYTLKSPGRGDGAPVLSVAGSGAVNLYTAGLAGAWNGDAYTQVVEFAVSGSGDWSDSTARNLITVGADGSNTAYLRKQTASNTLAVVRVGSGTTSSLTYTMSDTALHHAAVVANKAADRFALYIDGAQTGSVTGLGSWSGTPASTLMMIGASSSSRAAPWKGTLAGGAIHAAALSSIEIAQLAGCRGHIVFDGDSRLDYSSATPCPEQVMQVAGVKALRYGFTRTAVSGQTWSDMNGDAATEAGALYRPFWKNVAVGWAGVNDAVGGASAATIWSRMQTWAATMRGLGYKVVLCTEIDGQNVALNGVSWHGTIWPALNTLIAAGWSSVADGLADLGGSASLQDATNTTYFNADKVHLTTTGYGVAAGIIAAAVAAL